MIWVLLFYVLSTGDAGMINQVFHSEKECMQFIADNPPPEGYKPLCVELDSI